jgi:hypothetical protein
MESCENAVTPLKRTAYRCFKSQEEEVFHNIAANNFKYNQLVRGQNGGFVSFFPHHPHIGMKFNRHALLLKVPA